MKILNFCPLRIAYRQPTVGYAYLTDERGLTLRRVPPGRSYED